MSMKIIEDDLLNSDAQYIAHQCNCLTKKGAGLSYVMFKKFPHADIYSKRTSKDQPGTIVIRGSEKERYVINMLAQVCPGKPRPNDTKQMRIKWFQQCLEKISEIKDLDSIAFPHNIGCGLAGGDWKVYEKMLNEFASKTKSIVYLYKKIEN
jgi:O-acetyl-ADP-ribose deacetylase (regulator of RNase III)